METRLDEQGNEIVVVTPGKQTAKTRATATRVNDVVIARQAMEAWGKPLAYQAGQFWSYTPELGWEVCSDAFNVLCNDLRGSSTEQSVLKIVAAMVRVPDLELARHPTTYWELVSDSWIPFPVSSTQVLFSNGLLDLRSMEFTPTERRVVFGPRVSVPFDPDVSLDAICEEFEKLLEYALPDEDQRKYLQELCSLILQPHITLRGQVVFYGVPHSGKSTLATAIATAAGGSRGQSAVSEGRLTADKWALTMLVNKFVNISHDSEFTAKWESFMKQYTTGSFVAEPKFGKPVTVPATAKLISTCNEFQKVQDLSGALEQRYRVFRFNNPIAETGATDQSQYMGSAYWNIPERRVGIVGWMLRGLERVLMNGLHEPDSLKVVKRAAFYESNEVMEFVATGVIQAAGEFLPSEDLLAALGTDNYGTAAKMLPRYMSKVWGVTKIRKDGKRGYMNFKLA